MFIDGINHATLRVRNLDRSDYFYSQVLGLKRVGKRSNMYFYSSGRFAHELALLHDPDYRRSDNDGLMHLCFNVADEEKLHALYQHCQNQEQAPSGGVDHLVMHSFYLRDPDGHVLEIGMDRPAEEWKDNPRPFAEDLPLSFGMEKR
jgi:catechol 2,3-dioxygenase